MIRGGSRDTDGGVRDEPEGFAVALSIPQGRCSALASLLRTHCWMNNQMLHSKFVLSGDIISGICLWISLTDCSPSVFASLEIQMMIAY